MSRPPLKLVPGNGLDGPRVDVEFGEPGQPDHWRTALLEDWPSKPRSAQVIEANRRYDEWLTLVTAPPTPITPADLQANIDSLNEQLRLTMRQRLEVEDQLAAALANIPTVTAVQDGAWSDPNTWDTGIVPDTNVNVVIPPDVTVTVDNGVAITANVTADTPAQDPPPTEG